MPRSTPHLVALVIAALCAACGASATGGSISPAGAATSAPRTDRSVLTGAELSASRETNLYNAIERLRPDWLRGRGATSFNSTAGMGPDAINVYMDLQRIGTLESLKSMPLTSATSLRFFTASEAQQRFGTGNQNGVIQIVTTARP